jgi:lipoprotein-anchoring transpeptidase ErfK/SrfK
MRRLAPFLAAAALAGCGGASGERPAAGTQPRADAAARVQAGEQISGPVRRMGARVDRRTQLRDTPGGRVITTLGRRTGFRGRQVLAVVERRGGWLGVLHPAYARGRRAAWVPADGMRLLRRRYEIVVDRSALQARLLRDGEEIDRFTVGVGRRANPTPLGRYAVTDRIVPPPGSPYGCCILALTGRQPDLPQGWTGGDRLALHGGPPQRVGVETTSGCVTVGAADLRRLFGRITPGTRVTVTA